jgi:type VI secretion system protein
LAGRGLLSRIAGDSGPADEVDSIIEHLRVLLNTRQGDAIASPTFGVVDFSDVVHAMPGAVPSLVKSIRATVLEFEPRLRNVNVRHVSEDGDLLLRFEISAQLANQKGGRTLRFATTVRPGGRFDVGT